MDTTHSGSSHAQAAATGQAAAEATAAAALAAHTGDASSAHAASAISIADAGNDFTATDVEGALDELQADAETDAAALTTHESDTTSVHGITDTSTLYRSGGTDVAVADGGTGASTASGARTNLGVVPGTDVPTQAAFADHSARHENGGADEITLAGLDGIPTELQTHMDDASAAHAASAISANSSTLVGTGTDVQAVLEELDNGIADHLADTSDAHDASAISFSPTGSIAATDVQAAIAEVASEAGGGGITAHIFRIKVYDDETTIQTGDGQFIIMVDDDLDGMNLTAAHAYVTTVSSSGTPTVQVRNVTQTADMLSTRITIDVSEFTSYTAAAAPVIDTGNDDVATGDRIAIDVDVAGTGAKGLGVVLKFEAP